MVFNQPSRRSNTTLRSSTADRMEENKSLIALENGCFICGNSYFSVIAVRNHIRDTHGYDIPARPFGESRPQSIFYDYINRKNAQEFDEEHYACPSCWFHCPLDKLTTLYSHTFEQHDPIFFWSENEDEESTGTISRHLAHQLRSGQNRRSSRRHSNCSNNRFTGSRTNNYRGHISGEIPIGSNDIPRRRQGRASSDQEIPSSRSNSRQVHFSDNQEDTSLTEDRELLLQKFSELGDLIHKVYDLK